MIATVVTAAQGSGIVDVIVILCFAGALSIIADLIFDRKNK